MNAIMNNAEKFEEVFGVDATELLMMSESDFIKWLNSYYKPKYAKCKDCKWLSEERKSIGCKCVNPKKEFRSDTAHWRQPYAKACKLIEVKDEQ